MNTTDRPRASQQFPTPTHQVVLRNVATGGRVSRVSRVAHFDIHTARREADQRNQDEGREGRNVCWTIRDADQS